MSKAKVTFPAASGGTPYALDIEDEGSLIVSNPGAMNFTGGGVTVTENPLGVALVTIPSSTPYSLVVQDEGTPVVINPANMNFAGTGVTVTESPAGTALVTIPFGGLVNFLDTNSSFGLQISAILRAVNAGANVNAVFEAKGTGSTLAQTPDGTNVGGGARGIKSTDFQKDRSGATRVAGGDYSFIGAGQNNEITSASDWGVIVGGFQNETRGTYNAIVGGKYNLSLQTDTFIGGGDTNTASVDASAIAGGRQNLARGQMSFVGGGFQNDASGNYSVVAGGYGNTASGLESHVTGGRTNIASGARSRSGGYRGRSDRNNSDSFGFEAPLGYLQHVITGSGVAGSRASGSSFTQFTYQVLFTGVNSLQNLDIDLTQYSNTLPLGVGAIATARYNIAVKAVSNVVSIVGTPVLISNFENASFAGISYAFSISGGNLICTTTLPTWVGSSQNIWSQSIIKGSEGRLL